MLKKEALHELADRMAEQFQLGAHVAIGMLDEKGHVVFNTWKSRVLEAGLFSDSTSDDLRLIWIWDTLRQDSALRDVFKELSPAGMEWNRFSRPMFTLPHGSRFVIGVEPEASGELLFPSAGDFGEASASFQIDDDLYFRPGRGDRLECSPCEGTLYLRVAQTHAAEREMDILGVERDQLLAIEDKTLQIRVRSLNQAYTVASRRLEPNRMTHGGSAYEHIVYVDGQRKLKLEEIRRAVELGLWTIPESHSRPPSPNA